MLHDAYILEVGDVIPFVMSDDFSMITAKLNNDFAADFSQLNLAGLPVALDTSGSTPVATIVASGSEGTTDGLIATTGLARIKVGENYEHLVRILVRGPAKVNSNAFPKKDPDGVDYVVATITTALAALDLVVFENTNLGAPNVVQHAAFGPDGTNQFP